MITSAITRTVMSSACPAAPAATRASTSPTRPMTRRLPGVFLARGGVGLADLPLRILFILRVFSQGFADINAPLIQLRYLPSMTEPEEIIAAIQSMHDQHPDGAALAAAPAAALGRPDQPAAAPDHHLCRGSRTRGESRISKAFRAPVVEIYQASEGQIASPCRCGSLHINEDLVYVELLRRRMAGRLSHSPASGPAKMLVTNLVNTVQPLLRYEMNDIVELGEPCPCGSHFRVIGRIIGRQDDVLYLPDRSGGTCGRSIPTWSAAGSSPPTTGSVNSRSNRMPPIIWLSPWMSCRPKQALQSPPALTSESGKNSLPSTSTAASPSCCSRSRCRSTTASSSALSAANSSK